MIEFIVKYWLTFAFGLVAAGLGILAKKFYALWKNEKENTQNKMVADIKDELKAYNDKTLDELQKTNSKTLFELQRSNTALLSAILEVQGKQLRTDCQRLLETPNSITFEQFENLNSLFKTYKSLGGNGLGEELYNMVQEKYSMQMIQKDQVSLLAENFDIPRKCPLDDEQSTLPKHLSDYLNNKL